MKINLSKKTVFVLFVGTVFVFFSFKSNFFEVAKQIEIYNTLFKELNMYYIDEINPAELTNKAIKNTLKDLDPYTVFYDAQDIEDARIRKEGEYGGIGVSVYYLKKGIQINEIYKGYSADRAGLKVGDIIISIDEQPLKNMERDQLSLFLKGTPNSIFSIEILRQGELLKKEITRDKITVKAVPFAEMIEAETGYIALTRFNNNASFEVKKAFQKLKNQGMQRLVFDLRSNPGGSLLQSVNIANFFLPKGNVIVKTKAKVKKWSTTYKASNKPLDLEIPIVVLVNKRSASASEILAAAMQDYKRAIIIGSKQTYGKGTVQNVVDLNRWLRKNDQGDMGALKLTTQKFYRVNGGSTQLEGVKSDVVMPDRYSYFDVGERDYDNPLPYDKITPASFQLWEGYIDYQATIDKSRERIAQNNQLKLIEQNALYIKERRDQMDVTLNLTGYTAQIDENKQAVNKFDSLDTYDNKLSYRSLPDELVLMREDTTLVEKRKRWHKNLTKDVYLDEAISVLQDLKLANIKNGNAPKLKN